MLEGCVKMKKEMIRSQAVATDLCPTMGMLYL